MIVALLQYLLFCNYPSCINTYMKKCNIAPAPLWLGTVVCVCVCKFNCSPRLWVLISWGNESLLQKICLFILFVTVRLNSRQFYTLMKNKAAMFYTDIM